MRALRAGGPCTCAPDRYIRFVIPSVPGLRGFISCRGVESKEGDVTEHPLPRDGQIEVYLPGLD